MKNKIEVYDTTLRDGAQGPGVKFSKSDQLLVVKALDTLGVSYIEGGQPHANPKAADLFKRVRDIDLQNSTMVAFGSTRHHKNYCDDDPNLKALVEARTPVVTIFAKSSVSHVRDVLGITLKQNLTLVRESVAWLKGHDRRVFLDAEHFFAACREDQAYAFEVSACAAESGADPAARADLRLRSGQASVVGAGPLLGRAWSTRVRARSSIRSEPVTFARKDLRETPRRMGRSATV